MEPQTLETQTTGRGGFELIFTMQEIYQTYLPNRHKQAIKVIVGPIVLIVFIHLFYNQYYSLGTFLFIGIMFGFGLTVNGFSSVSLESVQYDENNQEIIINKAGLLRSKSVIIKKENFEVDLRTLSGKKSLFVNSLRLVFVDGINDVEEIHATNYFSKKKLRKIYRQLKEIEKQPIAEKAEKGFY